MFNKRISFVIVAIMLALSVVLGACGKKESEKSAKESLQEAFSQTTSLKSYNFSGSMKFEDFQMTVSEDQASVDMVANLLKNAEISWTGGYRLDPMMMEVNLKVDLKGDMAISFTLPVIMTETKTWIKVPNIPMLPLPQELVGKYLELDMNQLAEMAGEEMPQADVALMQKFGNDVMGIIFKHVDESQYLTDVKVKDSGLPSDLDLKKVIKLSIDQPKLEPFLKSVIEKIAPEILDLIASNAEYMKTMQLTNEDIDEAKAELANAQGELSTAMEEMKSVVKTLDIVSNIGLDKDNYPVYTDMSMKLAGDMDGEKVSYAAKVVSQLSNVNKDVKFDVGEPKAEDIIPFEKLMEDYGALMGGMSGM